MPRPTFDSKKVKRVINAGKWITGAGIFGYLFENIDDIVVGRVLGVGALGLYQMAYKFATLPITEVADVLGKVTFPIFVKISSDRERLKRAFVKVTCGVFLMTVPFGLIIIIFSSQILSLLGPSWVSASLALRAITVYSVIKALTNPALTVFLAVGKQRYLTVITLVGVVALSMLIYPMVLRFNILGAGLSTILAIIISLPVALYYTVKVFK